MKWRFLFLILLIAGLTAGSGCLSDSEYRISRQDAIDIAVKELPATLRTPVPGATTIYDETNWTVFFNFDAITGEDLGWMESVDTTFDNHGVLPEGEYSLIGITVDRRSGEVVKSMASDSVLLGGPGIWNNEPEEERYVPIWLLALVVFGGVLIGALAVWLFMRRRAAVQDLR